MLGIKDQWGPHLCGYLHDTDAATKDEAKGDPSRQRLYWLNAQVIVAALVEILAFAISEKKPPGIGSKSNNLRKNDYKRDETRRALRLLLKKMKALKRDVGGDKTAESHLVADIGSSGELAKFLPDFDRKIEEFKRAFPGNPISKTIGEVEELIEQIESLA